MGRDIRIASPSITICRANSLNDLNIRRGHRHIVATGDPVFRTRMDEPKRSRRKFGDLVVGVGSTP